MYASIYLFFSRPRRSSSITAIPYSPQPAPGAVAIGAVVLMLRPSTKNSERGWNVVPRQLFGKCSDMDEKAGDGENVELAPGLTVRYEV